MSDTFFDRIDRVDQVLAHGPHDCDYQDDLKDLLRDREVEQYFYKHAESPAWLQLLTAAGEIEPDSDSETWPASSYLKRIASSEPNDVSEILSKAAHTRNPSLIAHICDIAQELPVNQSERLMEPAIQWATLPSISRFGRQLVPLISQWASGSKVKELLNLLGQLLRLDDDSSPDQQNFFSPALATEPRIGNWLYERVLKEQIPEVYRADASGTLALLTDVLNRAIEEGREQGSPTDRIWPDRSQSWRPAIEEHGQNEPEDLTDTLIAAVRDYHEEAIDSKELSLPEAVSELESRQWALFVRLGLYLTKVFGSKHPDIVRNRLTDPVLFHSPACHHEFYLLQQRCFPLLEDSDRQTVLRMIDEELSHEDARTYLKQREDNISDEAVRRLIRIRKWKRLSAIAEHLTGERRDEYEALVKEFGQPEHPEFLIYSYGVQTGYVSPKSFEELAAKSPSQVVEFLNEWTPPDETRVDAPSREGLAQDLADLVADAPHNYVQVAVEFSGLPGVYARGFIDGLVRAAKDEKHLEWTELFPLFQTLMENYSPNEYGETDNDGHGMAKSISTSVARFIDEALKHPSSSPPMERRNDVWAILARLMRFQDPPFDKPKPDSKESFDPVFRAINSVRGRTFYALMRFSGWLDRNLNGSNGFTTIPELGELLDWHLKPENDASLAIRSAYGIWLPWLYRFDEDWVKPRIQQIFPEEESLQDYWWAAWDGFVGYSTARASLFELLETQYTRALHRLEEAKRRSEGHSSDIGKRTAQHIMVLYWNGVFESADSDLIRTLYVNAPSDLCAESIRFVGRSLRNSDESVPSNIIQRLESLWRWRLSERRRESTAVSSDELVAFAWWFYSGAFDDEVALDLMQQSLELASKIPDNPYMIVSKLAHVADSHPESAVRLLRQIANSEEGIWALQSNNEAAVSILRAGLASKEESTARDLIDHLGRQGMMELRDLHTSGKNL